MIFLFLGAGVWLSECLLPRKRPLVRWYVGASLGVLLMMWLPVLWAYAIAFTVKAHVLAAATLVPICAAAWFGRDRRAKVRFAKEDRRMLVAVLCVALPLTLLAGWLEYTHSIRPAADGTYHVGQSTYGDLSLHLAVATSIVNAQFPLQNSLMLGATMAYPYLCDSFATSFYLFGCSLPAAMAITGTLLCGMVFCGFALLCTQLCRRRGAVALAVCLLFLNGGLGFVYTLSGTVENGVVTTAWDNLQNVMTGYYQTPTNQPDPNNLRWVNIICDMLIPQRGILGGWSMLMPALNLLLPPLCERRRHGAREMLLAGLIAGGMPLLHTHSFLALALCSVGVLAYTLATAPRGKHFETFEPFLLYGCVAAALSLPQLICFTFVQATGSDHFLRFQFNWCNNRGGNGLVDNYFWFYLKNIGLPYVLIFAALLQRRSGNQGELAATADERAAHAPSMANGARVPWSDAPAGFADGAPQPKQDGADFAEPLPVADMLVDPLDETATEPLVLADAERAQAAILADDAVESGADFARGGSPNGNADFARNTSPDGSTFAASAVPQAFARASSDGNADFARNASPDGSTFAASAVPQASARASLNDDEPHTCFADVPPARDFVRQNRLIACGAFLILLIAEFILFQPNEYDNNKLIYVWFLLLLPMVADYACELYARLKGLGGRRLLAALFLGTCFLSAGLTVARECVSDYQAYSAQDIAAAEFVRENTPEHSVFLTGNQHLNPVASLAGRTILCGSDLYLYYHGFNTTQRKAELAAMYEDPVGNAALYRQYGVEYVYISASERYNYEVNETALRSLYRVIYDEGGTVILATDGFSDDDTASGDGALPADGDASGDALVGAVVETSDGAVTLLNGDFADASGDGNASGEGNVSGDGNASGDGASIGDASTDGTSADGGASSAPSTDNASPSSDPAMDESSEG